MSHPTEVSPISVEALRPLISTRWLGQSLYVFDQLASTNAYASQLAETDAAHGTVILSDCQTAGKGRFGREWHSPAGTNIYSSVILSHKPPQPFISWIPLMAGVAVAEAIEGVADLKVSLKWPNDILYNTRKLGGILCESTINESKGWVVIVGVGLNINSHENHFPQDLRKIATSLAIQTGDQFDRHVLLASFFSKFESYYDQILGSDLPNLHSSYKSRCSTVGRQIQVQLHNGNLLEGFASDIGNEGELCIIPSTSYSRETEPLPIALRAGDIIHVR